VNLKASTRPTPADVHATAIRLAAELCDATSTWRYCHERAGHVEHANAAADGLYPTATIVNDAGLELAVRYNTTNRTGSQFTISQYFHTAAWESTDGQRADPRVYRTVTPYGCNELPSINVATAKTPAKIADDVVRRLLPAAIEHHDRAMQIVCSRNDYARELNSTASRFGIELARLPNRRGYPSRTLDIPGGGRVEIECHTAADVCLKVENVDAKLALKILDLIGVKI